MKVVSRTIDTIVVFRGGSKPLPYKFRYTEDDGQSREVIVGRIFIAEEQKVGGRSVLSYDCQSRIAGKQRRYQLKYHVAEQSWELYKI